VEVGMRKSDAALIATARVFVVLGFLSLVATFMGGSLLTLVGVLLIPGFWHWARFGRLRQRNAHIPS
jgi:fatty acid desaturase